MCILMMCTLFHFLFLMFSFIRWDSCFFNWPSWWGRSDILRPCSLFIPPVYLCLVLITYMPPTSDCKHTLSQTRWLIEPHTLLGIWWKPPSHNNECQHRREDSTAQNRIKLNDAAWGLQLINEIVLLFFFLTIADLINLYRIRLCLSLLFCLA